MTAVRATAAAPKRFEWWMTANLAFGAGYGAFLPVLVPTYIISVGGSATDVGVAMSMVGLLALAGPTIGNFTSRHRAFRTVQALGVLALGTGFAVLALAAGGSLLIVLAVAVIGIGTAALLVVSPTLIVGAGLSQADQAKQFTSLQITLEVGKIVGGAILGGLAAANLSFDTQFWIVAGLLAAVGVFVWTVNGPATRRLLHAAGAADRDRDGTGNQSQVSLRSVFVSLFGLTLLAMVLATMTSTVVNSQLPNIFGSVFSFSVEQVSSMVSISGVVGIVLYLVAGRWMARSGPLVVWTFGNGIRGVGGLLLAILGTIGDSPLILVFGGYLLVESCAAFARVAHIPAAVRFASLAAAVTAGWIAASQALGQAAASIGAGALADATGSFLVLLWVAGALGITAGAIGYLVLIPVAKRRGISDVPGPARVPREAAGQAELVP